MNKARKHFLTGAAIGTILFVLPSLWLYNKAETSKKDVADWKDNCTKLGGKLLTTSSGYLCAKVSGSLFEIE